MIGSRAFVPVGDYKATIDPTLIDLHFDNDATGSIPAVGSIKKLVKLTLFFLQLNEPQPSPNPAGARPLAAGEGFDLTQ